MNRLRMMVLSIVLATSTCLVPASARAEAIDPSGIAEPSASSSFASMTPEQIYAAKTAVTHDQFMKQLGVSEPTASSSAAVSAAGVCAFASDGDYVHRSKYSGVWYASGHGYWWNYTCPSSYRANVTIWLEEKLGSTWYLQGSPVTGYNRAPGSGSSQRVNNKLACVNTSKHQWRSIIRADIVGHADTSPLAYTAAQPLDCY